MEAAKADGIAAYQRGDLERACKIWERALHEHETASPSLRFTVANNYALAALRLGRHVLAFMNANKALQIAKAAAAAGSPIDDAQLAKAHYRSALGSIGTCHGRGELMEQALENARKAAAKSPTDTHAVALCKALEYGQDMTKENYDAFLTMPRCRPVELTGWAELFNVGHCTLFNLFGELLSTGGTKSLRPGFSLISSDPKAQVRRKAISSYCGGVGDGRLLLSSLSSFGAELIVGLAAEQMPTRIVDHVVFYLNDHSPQCLVRLMVLLTILNRIAQREDVLRAVPDPLTENVETRLLIYAYYASWGGVLVPLVVKKLLSKILKKLGSGDWSVLPKWMHIDGDEQLKLKLQSTASEMVTLSARQSIEGVMAAARMSQVQEQGRTIGLPSEKIANLPETQEMRALAPLSLLERDVYYMPLCRKEIEYTHANLAFPAPPGVSNDDLRLNPLNFSLHGWHRGTGMMLACDFEVFKCTRHFYSGDITKKAPSLYHIGSRLLGDAAIGLLSMQRLGFALEVHMRLGDMALDLDALSMQGVKVWLYHFMLVMLRRDFFFFFFAAYFSF